MGLDFSHGGAMWSYSRFTEFQDRLAAEAVRYPWSGTGEDPVRILIEHSNGEGFIKPADCDGVATRLLTLIADWDRFEDDDTQDAELLAKGLRMAARRNERFEFR